MDILVLLFAALSGCCGSLAAIAISGPAHQARGKPLPKWKQTLSLVANLALTAVQVAFGFLATKFGPVAVVMPLSVGAALLSNMMLQQALGLAKFTNSAITGTLVLVTAILMLPELGPSPPEQEVPPLQLLQAPRAILFIGGTVLACFGSLAALLLHKVSDNMAMLTLFALVGASGTVLNMSIQKMLMSDPAPAVATVLLAAYVTFSILCLGSGALANGTLRDPSLFVPLNNATNLFLNCMAGLCIWRDTDNLEYPWSYFMVYTLIGLGSYLVSSIDVFSMVHLNLQRHLSEQVPGVARRMGSLRRAITMPVMVSFDPKVNEELLRSGTIKSVHDFKTSFPHLHAGINLLNSTSRGEFEKRMLTELHHRMITDKDLVRLIGNLLEETGGFSNNHNLTEWVSTITSDVSEP